MNRRDKNQAPRLGMIWSEKRGMWIDPDHRTAAQRARDEKIAGDVEGDRKRVEAALGAAEAARNRPTSQVEKTADQVAVRLLRSLIEARKKAKLSQAEVARRMQVSQPAVVRLESGTHSPTLTTLARYAAAIGVKLEIRRNRVTTEACKHVNGSRNGKPRAKTITTVITNVGPQQIELLKNAKP